MFVNFQLRGELSSVCVVHEDLHAGGPMLVKNMFMGFLQLSSVCVFHGDPSTGKQYGAIASIFRCY